MQQHEAEAKVAGLTCWGGRVQPEPVGGGISNHNFRVVDRGEAYFVRIGGDVPVHGVMRSFEIAVSRAAHAAGISPELMHAEEDALVFRFLDGRTLTADDVRHQPMLERIVPFIRRFHALIPRHLRGRAPMFWPFHAIRDYGHRLLEDDHRLKSHVPDWLEVTAVLEAAALPGDIVLAHNDLLAANLIDDGERLWLFDWEYGGFNSPLFDLANLTSNNGLDADAERFVLESYHGRSPEPALVRAFAAMTCTSLLREALWSAVSERHLTVDFDYEAYTAEFLRRFDGAYAAFRQLAR